MSFYEIILLLASNLIIHWEMDPQEGVEAVIKFDTPNYSEMSEVEREA